MLRENTNQQLQARATDAQNQSWESRQREHDGPSGQKLPSLCSLAPSPFIWVNENGDEDERSGFLLRKPLAWTSVENYWFDCHQSERIYDPISNAWDLCKPAGCGLPPPTFDGLDDDGIEIFQEDVDATQRVMWLPPQNSSLENLSIVGKFISATSDQYHSCHSSIDKLQHLLQDRYSFVSIASLPEPLNRDSISAANCFKILVHHQGTRDFDQSMDKSPLPLTLLLSL